MYDPVTARFLQEDTYGGDPNDPLSLNRYTYSVNNPLRYYDPTGHWPNFSGFFSGISSAFSSWGNSISSAWNNSSIGSWTNNFYQEHEQAIKGVGIAVGTVGLVAAGIAVLPEAAIVGAAWGVSEVAALTVGSGFIGAGAFLGSHGISDYLDNNRFDSPLSCYNGALANGFTTGALMSAGGLGGFGLAGRMAWNGLSAFEGSSIGQYVSTGSIDYTKSIYDGVTMAVATPAFEIGAIGLSKAWNYGSSILKQSSFKMPEFKIPQFNMTEFRMPDIKTSELGTVDAYIPGGRTSILKNTVADNIYRSNSFREMDLQLFGGTGVSDVAKWSSEKGIYSVGYEVNLPKDMYPNISSTRHFQEANKQLYEAFQKDSGFAQQMEELYPGINNGVQPGARGAFSRKPPTDDVTWHHHPDREGVMQLMPFEQHTAKGPIQSILHPDRKGGMENWGGGR